MTSPSILNKQDVLDWSQFKDGSIENYISKPNKSKAFNRLIFETKNFFSIVGYGCFNLGYVLLITKDFCTSFSHIEKNIEEEFNFIKEFIIDFTKKKYNADTLIFEHGMCSCAGGLDHAHMHFMAIPTNTSEADLKDSINKTLKIRGAGIEEIEFKNTTFNNVHDISSIINFDNEYKITKGRLLKFEDLRQYKGNISQNSKKLNLTDQYVYLEHSKFKEVFITNYHLGTQFGREVVYQINYNNEKKFKQYCDDLMRSDRTKLVWRWQDYMFDENIINTMSDYIDHIKTTKPKIFEFNKSFKG